MRMPLSFKKVTSFWGNAAIFCDTRSLSCGAAVPPMIESKNAVLIVSNVRYPEISLNDHLFRGEVDASRSRASSSGHATDQRLTAKHLSRRLHHDLDDFKALNDTHGHQAGDGALEELATLVGGGARASDVACRCLAHGGEISLVLLNMTSCELLICCGTA